MIKAVFIDIDDTLLTNNREITKETKEAIDYQKEFNTSPYIISSNGSSCYDQEKKQEIYNENIKKGIVLELLKYCQENQYRIRLNYKDRLVLNRATYPDEKDKEVSNEELEKIAQLEKIVQVSVSDSDLEKMKKFKEYLKINTNEIIAIGDGENDISMFEITPNSIAMENAVPLAKEKAKYQTLSNNKNGVAHVLKNI